MLRKKKSLQPHRKSADFKGPQTFNEAEKLVGIGLRCWLAGYETCDIQCWETGWNYYARTLGTTEAKSAISELSSWMRTLRFTSCRRIAYYPYGCAGFCHDECVAISMVAASQHQHCPALKACAFALLGTSLVDEALGATVEFASVLDDMNQVLSSDSICNAIEPLKQIETPI